MQVACGCHLDCTAYNGQVLCFTHSDGLFQFSNAASMLPAASCKPARQVWHKSWPAKKAQTATQALACSLMHMCVSVGSLVCCLVMQLQEVNSSACLMQGRHYLFSRQLGGVCKLRVAHTVFAFDLYKQTSFYRQDVLVRHCKFAIMNGSLVLGVLAAKPLRLS